MTWLDDFAQAAHAGVDDRVTEALNLRGVSDDQILSFSVGYVNKVIPSLAYPEEFLKWSGRGGKLEDCYCFPLTTPLGETVGFQFRPIVRERKNYMDYFTNTGEPALFGFRQAMPKIWLSKSVTLVEGPFDLFPIQRHDPTVVATLTARVTDVLVRNLKRWCSQIIIGYDNDPTGLRATRQCKKEHSKSFHIQELTYPRVPMPGGRTTKDPADLWELWGDQQLGEYVRKRRTEGSSHA